MRARPSRQVGVIGEKLVAGWLATKGFNVNRSPNADAARVIEGKRTEIKFSTLWESGVYRFQQIRDQDYELLICLGVSPFDAHCWAIPKREVVARWKAGEIQSQHGGTSGQETGWLFVQVGHEPDWLQKWGGHLGEAARVTEQLTGFQTR